MWLFKQSSHVHLNENRLFSFKEMYINCKDILLIIWEGNIHILRRLYIYFETRRKDIHSKKVIYTFFINKKDLRRWEGSEKEKHTPEKIVIRNKVVRHNSVKKRACRKFSQNFTILGLKRTQNSKTLSQTLGDSRWFKRFRKKHVLAQTFSKIFFMHHI